MSDEYVKTTGVNTVARDAVCRRCGKGIPRGSSAFVMRGVHVSPKMVDLWWHTRCMKVMTRGLHGDAVTC